MKSITAVQRTAAVIILIGAISVSSGCATITKGNSQAFTVDTRPPGAVCTLSRDGDTLAVVNPTPGTINISKDKDVIRVSCIKEGYKTNLGDVGSEFQAMTLGNVLFGGLIGVAVDAGSGAMNQYPPTVTLTLIPESFESETQRDVFFDQMRDQFIIESDASMQRIEKSCPQRTCQQQLKAARKARDLKLEEIERERLLAVVQ